MSNKALVCLKFIFSFTALEIGREMMHKFTPEEHLDMFIRRGHPRLEGDVKAYVAEWEAHREEALQTVTDLLDRT